MAKIKDALKILCDFAPLDLAEGWDNVGLICGDSEAEITGIVICLDATDDALNEALKTGANLMVTHHPVLFPPIFDITSQNSATAMAYKLIKNGISVISMHTNLDCCEGGVGDALALKLGINATPLGKFLRMGNVHATSLNDYAEFIEKSLNTRVSTVDCGKIPSEIALSAGAFDLEFLEECIKHNIDTVITGEAKYSLCVYAKNAGINMIIAGHHETEAVILPKLKEILSDICENTFICAAKGVISHGS